MSGSETRVTSTMAPAEETAAQVVVSLLAAEHDKPVSFEHWDVPPRQGAHDFWIHHGETREALEITTLAEQDTKTNAAHWQKRGPGYTTTFDHLTSAWMIMVDPAFNASMLKKKLAGWLQTLESEGITETGRWDSHRMYTHPVTTALAAAGVMIASAISGPPAGLVSLCYPSCFPPRPAGDPDHVSRALTEVLALERHQKDAAKLDRSGVPVRHLFLWVDVMSRLDVVHALSEGVPTLAPRVDGRITEVWLAVPTENGAEVLRWSAPIGWRRDDVAV